MNTMKDCKKCGSYKSKNGAEAEDLRRAIEKLVKECAYDDEGKKTIYVEDVQIVLDEVDARDSLQFLLDQDSPA